MTLFPPPPINAGHIVPRPYQEEALEALDHYVCTKDTSPCVVIPTGGGKSVLMAWAIQQWKAAYPPFRVCVLAHRKELVQQNADELAGLWPGGDIGIYSAGLGRKDEEHSVLFASIDSIHRKWGAFPPWDCIIIDEAHRIPASGEGKYRGFIRGCRIINKKLCVIGFTATPFRMGGPICHKDHILNQVCYEANVGDLIAQGYLCKLRSKVGDVQPDLSAVKRNSGGDYIGNSLAAAVDTDDVVGRAVRSAMGHIGREGRKSIVFFCVDVDHCRRVSNELRKFGVDAPMVTAKTPPAERDRIAEGFKAGRYHAITNVNVYTEGFNAKRVDCIVLLRPTLSKGLYVQMVGRGLRPHESKSDCLVLDYAHCIDEHGPIDCIDAGRVTMMVCGSCGDSFSRAIRTCPHCGWTIPKQEIERAEGVEREKRLHEAEASQRAIIGSQPEHMDVASVMVERHRKSGSPDSIRVQYRCGLSSFNEWLCLDHAGYAQTKSRRWWWERFGKAESEAVTVDKALGDMFLGNRIKDVTKLITVVRRGKYSEIVGYQMTDGRVIR
jgi:DNA repair protein RadD